MTLTSLSFTVNLEFQINLTCLFFGLWEETIVPTDQFKEKKRVTYLT